MSTTRTVRKTKSTTQWQKFTYLNKKKEKHTKEDEAIHFCFCLIHNNNNHHDCSNNQTQWTNGGIPGQSRSRSRDRIRIQNGFRMTIIAYPIVPLIEAMQ
eukprot:10489704-Ditylum_brightwellii.AAC.1